MGTNKRYEILRELWKITEMRDGCVYDTQFVKSIWLEVGDDLKTPQAPDGYLYATPSTKAGTTIRVKK